MKKVEFVGWMGKGMDLKFQIDREDSHVSLPPIYKIKGSAADWAPISYPPRKVRVTIEEVE